MVRQILLSVTSANADQLHSADADNATVEAAARCAEKAQPFLEGKTVRKVIIVPKKMVNIVVG